MPDTGRADAELLQRFLPYLHYDSLESYRAMGRNAAAYAGGEAVGPVPTELDNFARAKLIVRTTLLHARETAAVVPGAEPVELEFR